MGATFAAALVRRDGLDAGSTIVVDAGSGVAAVACHDGHLPDRFSVYRAQVLADEPLTIQIMKDDIYPCFACVDHFFPESVELCAGTGAMGSAAAYMGARSLGLVDHNALVCDFLRLRGQGAVYHGDIGDLHVLERLHGDIRASCSSFTLMAGFPCQPFSVQGDRAHFEDGRAATFDKLIRATELLQPQALLLECVPTVAGDSHIAEQLLYLQRVMNWQKEEVILNLDEQWPMKRTRWFCLMRPHAWGKHPLVPWSPLQPRPVIRDVLPHWGSWPESDLLELMLSEDELRAFMDPLHGSDKRLITLDDVAPVVLHAYGSQLTACPCGCRSKGFSSETLRRRGLRGFFICDPVSRQPRLLHPAEVATLLSMDNTLTVAGSLRATLCLYGNAAAPLQVVWCFATLAAGASLYIDRLTFIHPNEVLTHYRRRVREHFVQTVPSPDSRLAPLWDSCCRLRRLLWTGATCS